ncbi:MAG: hypothetical protein DVB31_13410 [Verrucomicrobia bacterium]|nr:MAG: hypothetical protein DVB31_13410 [Verrucomicrobiota bacterium]
MRCVCGRRRRRAAVRRGPRRHPRRPRRGTSGGKSGWDSRPRGYGCRRSWKRAISGSARPATDAFHRAPRRSARQAGLGGPPRAAPSECGG